jgi:hypothetical protein
MVGTNTVPNGAFGAEVAVPVMRRRLIRPPAAAVRGAADFVGGLRFDVWGLGFGV